MVRASIPPEAWEAPEFNQEKAQELINKLVESIYGTEVIEKSSAHFLETVRDSYLKHPSEKMQTFARTLSDERLVDISLFAQGSALTMIQGELEDLKEDLLDEPIENWHSSEHYLKKIEKKIHRYLQAITPTYFETAYAKWASSIDAKTGLYNDRIYNEVLDSSIRKEKPVGVLFCDIDLFAVLNDVLGHFLTDEVLIEIANRIKKNVRKTDTVCRYGGDEITVILPKVDDNEKSLIPANKVSEAINQPVLITLSDRDVQGMKENWRSLHQELSKTSNEFENWQIPHVATLITEGQSRIQDQVSIATEQEIKSPKTLPGDAIDMVDVITKYHHETNQELNFSDLTKARGAFIVLDAVLKALQPHKIADRINGIKELYRLNIQPSLSSVCTYFRPQDYQNIPNPKGHIETNLKAGLKASKKTRKALTVIDVDGSTKVIPTNPIPQEDTISTSLS